MVNRLEIGHSAEHMIICVRKGVYSDIINGLNQIGIKIDMYRQEHRFSPATPYI